MTGDSALATVWRHRWLWLGFVRRDITSRYLGSVGGMAWALMLPLSLSYDHRVIDGAVGARFLQTLRGLLEAPMMMLF